LGQEGGGSALVSDEKRVKSPARKGENFSPNL
jgi:hypothetical protein